MKKKQHKKNNRKTKQKVRIYFGIIGDDEQLSL